MPIDLTRARSELRRQALLDGLYAVYPRALGAGQLVDGIPDDVAVSVDEVSPDVSYLADAGLVRLRRSDRRRVDILALTAAGVDAVEAERIAQARRARDEAALARVRSQRMLRLRVLQALRWVYPAVARPVLVARSLEDDVDLDLSLPSIEAALAYLTDPDLELATEANGLYRATTAGIDYLDAGREGADDIPGVATPL